MPTKYIATAGLILGLLLSACANRCEELRTEYDNSCTAFRSNPSVDNKVKADAARRAWQDQGCTNYNSLSNVNCE